jgi:hypothetical protein
MRQRACQALQNAFCTTQPASVLRLRLNLVHMRLFRTPISGVYTAAMLIMTVV